MGNAAVKILERFKNHPIVKQIEAEGVAEVLEGRTELAAKIAEARKRAEKVMPELRAKIDAVKDELREHEEARRALITKLGNAQTAYRSESTRIEKEIFQARAQLLENYDPVIDEAILFFRGQHDWLRKQDITREKERKLDLAKGGTKFIVRTNFKALNQALEHCRAAVFELEAMKLLPAVDLERIEVLKQIPDFKQLDEGGARRPS